MEYILETNNLCKNHGRHKVLNDFNMHIEKGAIYGLIGKNGVGKTTFIRVICGLQKPTKGSYSIYGISFNDKNIVNSRRRMGAMIESPSIYMELSARENLIQQYKVVGMPSLSGIDELLALVDLKHVGNKKAKSFSLGMKQRLGIAIALSSHPDFLILDEPINGLDPQGIIEIRELILHLNQKRAITFLISSHYLDELARLATHYGFVNDGRVVKELRKDELSALTNKRIEVKVSNVNEFVKYCEEMHITYEVTGTNSLNIFDKAVISRNEALHDNINANHLNISKMVLELYERNCLIEEYHEKEESLENYYMNLIGGREHV